MKTIKLTKGKVTQIDDDLYSPLSQWKWMYHPKNYAYRTEWNHGNKIHIFMHNEVLGVEGCVDHINNNGLNNTRANLRLATKSQNGANRKSRGYKGIVKEGNQYHAQIWHKGKKYKSGGVRTERQAAWLYDLAARELFGEFARLNLT